MSDALRRAAFDRRHSEAQSRQHRQDSLVSAVSEIVRGKGGARQLAEIDLALWYDVEPWVDVLNAAFRALPVSEVNSVLEAWIGRVEGHIRLIDAVLFRVVRPMRDKLGPPSAWIQLAVRTALETRDPSLLETLVYTLGKDLVSFEDLTSVVMAERANSANLRRAIERTFEGA